MKKTKELLKLFIGLLVVAVYFMGTAELADYMLKSFLIRLEVSCSEIAQDLMFFGLWFVLVTLVLPSLMLIGFIVSDFIGDLRSK